MSKVNKQSQTGIILGNPIICIKKDPLPNGNKKQHQNKDTQKELEVKKVLEPDETINISKITTIENQNYLFCLEKIEELKLSLDAATHRESFKKQHRNRHQKRSGRVYDLDQNTNTNAKIRGEILNRSPKKQYSKEPSIKRTLSWQERIQLLPIKQTGAHSQEFAENQKRTQTYMNQLAMVVNKGEFSDMQIRAECKGQKELFYEAATKLAAKNQMLAEQMEFQLTKCNINLQEMIRTENKRIQGAYVQQISTYKFTEIILSLRRLWELLDGVPKFDEYCTKEADKYFDLEVYYKTKRLLLHWEPETLMLAEYDSSNRVMCDAITDLVNTYRMLEIFVSKFRKLVRVYGGFGP